MDEKRIKADMVWANFAAMLLAACLAHGRALTAAEAPPAGPDPGSPSRQGEIRSILRSVTAPEGFTATAFATPEQASYPVFVAATCDGTVFVSSDGNASTGRDPHRGKILRLRDTDGDGMADEVKAFVPDLDSPRGLVWTGDRLLVLHPPNITSFRDHDGDGVADERTPVIRGIAFDMAERPADHTSNGLTLGIDGWVYAAIGDFGFMNAEGADGRRLQLRGGGVVRFRRDGTGLDLFARGTRNTLEVTVGPLLDMVARDNTNDGGGWNVRLHAFTGLEDHGYPRRYMHFADEIVPPLADYGGGSGCGGCWIDEPWMPARWNDAPFTCDWGRNQIYRHPLAAEGAGYQAGQEEFTAIARATDLDVDAMGNIYASSWRGGYYMWTGPKVGFIARIRPDRPGAAAQSPAVPEFQSAPAEELARTLAGPSHRLRLASQAALVERGLVAGVRGELESLAADRGARLASRVAATFTLALGLQAKATPGLVNLSVDPTIAPWAIRALGDLAAAGVAVPRDSLLAALASSDARTRKEAVVALVRTDTDAAAADILPLAGDADPTIAHTVVEGLVRLTVAHEPAVIAVCVAVIDATGTTAAVHRAAARVLGEIHSQPAVEAVKARLARAEDDHRRADLAWAAARLWRRESAWKGENWGTRPDTRGPYYAPEEWDASAGLLEAMLAAAKACPDTGLESLARAYALHGLPGNQVLPLVAHVPAGLVTYLDITGGQPRKETMPAVMGVAVDASAAMSLRLAAVRVLCTGPLEQLFDAVVSLEASGPPEDVKAAARTAMRRSYALMTSRPSAVRALARKGPAYADLVDEALLAVAGNNRIRSDMRSEATEWLVAEWNRTPARRLGLTEVSVRTGSKALALELVAATEQAADPALAAVAADALRKLAIDPQAIRALASDTGPAIGSRKPDHVLKLVEDARGDRTLGAELFVKQKCSQCHAAGIDSTGLGPSLANAAGIFNRRQLAENVLLPNKTIAQGFATTALLLEDGRQLVGFVTSEAADSVALRDAQGAEHRIEKTSIEERTTLPTSVMPEGLVADLTILQFASLLDYVESLGAAKPAP